MSKDERALLARLLQLPELRGCDVPFSGNLTLGAAREVLQFPAAKRESEVGRVVSELCDAMAWRATSDADRIGREGIDERLVSNECQAEAHHYGQTHGGLPVIVDDGSEWRRSIYAAKRAGFSAEEYATTRIYWHETCCAVAERAHAEGQGNGQFIHIIDLGGLSDLTFGQVRELWPYIKASILLVSNNYTGTARRIYIARPPMIFSFGWSLCKVILSEYQRCVFSQLSLACVASCVVPCGIERVVQRVM